MKEKVNYLSHDFFRRERARAKKLTGIGEEIMRNSKQVRVDGNTIRLDRMTDEEIARRDKENGK